MNRHADFLPGEAGFLLGLLQEVGGLKTNFFFVHSILYCVCQDHSCGKNFKRLYINFSFKHMIPIQ